MGTAMRVRRSLGNAGAKVQRRQQRGAKAARHHVVDEGDGQIERRDRGQDTSSSNQRQLMPVQRAMDSGIASRPAATAAPALT